MACIKKARTKAVETCPYCESENVFPNYDTCTNGYKARCQHCGKEIMLCDECLHAEDNKEMKCDWRPSEVNDDVGVCFRGITRN